MNAYWEVRHQLVQNLQFPTTLTFFVSLNTDDRVISFSPEDCICCFGGGAFFAGF